MFLLTLDGTQQRARSLAYAKALAPQMFQRSGTQKLFRSIVITEESTGEKVASYGRMGWRDDAIEGLHIAVGPEAIDAVLAAVLECPGCDGYRPANKPYCTLRCKLDNERRIKAESTFAGIQQRSWGSAEESPFDTREEQKGEV